MDIFNFKTKKVDDLTRNSNVFVNAKQVIQEMIEQKVPENIVIDTEEVKEMIKDLDDVQKEMAKQIRKETVLLNPAFDNQLINQVKWFEEDFIKQKIPGAPSYIVERPDGKYEISLGLVLDLMELKENEIGFGNIYDLVEDVSEGVKYDRYDMGNGFSINSYGSVYYNDDRVFNPKAIETIPVYLLDFTTENIMFGYNHVENGENNYLFRDSFLKKTDDSIGEYGKKHTGKGTGIRIPMAELGFDVNTLKNAFLFKNPGSKYYIPGEATTAQLNYAKPIYALDGVNLKDFNDAFGSLSESELIDKLINSVTNPNRLNAEVITEEDDPAKKNYLLLLFLLLIGGGQMGKAPLPMTASPCDRYYKPQRRGLGFGNVEPGNGCVARDYATGHKKVLKPGQYNGVKTSLLQLLYQFLTLHFHINIKGIKIEWGVKVLKQHIGFSFWILPAISIGGEIEHGLCKLQEKVSEQIRKFFSVKKYIKMPQLNQDGSGYSFENFEKFDLTNYSEIQVEMFYRLNFARIFEFVEKEELYTVGENDEMTLDSKLSAVIKVYSNIDTYALKEMNKYKKLTPSMAKEMYQKGFHILYNDNESNDNYVTGIQDGNKTYDDISPSNIWTILKNSMEDIDICEAKELNLEVFNGNRYTSKGIKYSYKF